jgi:hypothetical protein
MTTKNQLLARMREKCIDCTGGERQERLNCTATDCPLHPHRKGEAAGRSKAQLLRVLRQKCLSCMCGSAHEIKLCGSGNCSLRPFRFGRDPSPNPVRQRQTVALNEKRLLGDVLAFQDGAAEISPFPPQGDQA